MKLYLKKMIGEIHTCGPECWYCSLWWIGMLLETEASRLCGPRNHSQSNGGTAIEFENIKSTKEMYFKQARVGRGESYSAHGHLNLHSIVAG